MSRTRWIVGLLVVASLVWAGSLLAHSGGASGVARSATGCNCHSTTPNANGTATVTITGPQAVQPGSSHSYTITVTGGPSGTTGGFDLNSGGGTFTPGTGTKLLNGDLVHSDGTRRSWTFSWQAPSTQGTVNWYAVAQPTNGSGTSGDSWNWYGGGVNTAFPITVSSQVDVASDRPGVLSLASLAPNPCFGSTTIDFTLARQANVRLDVVDVGGRLVTTLFEGTLGAGRHERSWEGRRSSGQAVASGIYAIRLQAEGRVLTRRVVLLQ